MSGTSADGVDAALIETDGLEFIRPIRHMAMPYSPSFQARLLEAAQEHKAGRDLEVQLTLVHQALISNMLQQEGLLAKQLDVIGFHGFTIGHWPERFETKQIGDATMMAHEMEIPVVHRFRDADMAAGGQGAPLVPLYHQALTSNLAKPVVLLNIGGVANVTYIGEGGTLLAFDTGPGNALLDDWVRQHSDLSYDADGAFAARGEIQTDILAQLLAHPYFQVKPPKSLDRNAFSLHPLRGLSLVDGAATLTAFTTASIAKAIDYFPQTPEQWIAIGGGAENKTMIQSLSELVHSPVQTGKDIGWQNQAIEAQAFAYLAVRCLRGLPTSLPQTTGVKMPTVGGQLVRPTG